MQNEENKKTSNKHSENMSEGKRSFFEVFAFTKKTFLTNVSKKKKKKKCGISKNDEKDKEYNKTI